GRGAVVRRPAAWPDRGGGARVPRHRGGAAGARARASLGGAAPAGPPPGSHDRPLIGGAPARACDRPGAIARRGGGSTEPARLHRPTPVAGPSHRAIAGSRSGSPAGTPEGDARPVANVKRGGDSLGGRRLSRGGGGRARGDGAAGVA